MAVKGPSIFLDNVGIGIAQPTEKLAVNGNIKAKEIKIEATNWPDYVFKSTYKMPTLKELKRFIETNNHLPEIPSSSEIKNDGLNIGEMNTKLLKKIEELTLYLIELEKKVEDQQMEINLWKKM